MHELSTGETLERSCAKAGMSEKTGRKWRRAGRLPGECREPRGWRTRADPFSAVWGEVEGLLMREPGLQARRFLRSCSGGIRGGFVRVNCGRCSGG